MAKTKQQDLHKFDAYFLPDSFLVEFPSIDFGFGKLYNKSDDKSAKELETKIKSLEDTFLSDRYSALFYLGFSEKEKWFSPSVEYLYKISETQISKISKLPEIELVRENILLDISEDELLELKEEVPFAVGMEYVDDEWISDLWEKLLNVFRSDIKSFDSDVA